MDDIRETLRIMGEFLDEFTAYYEYRGLLLKSVKKLESQYLKKQITYEKYVHLLERILEGKTKQEAIKSYDLYLLDLLEKLEYENSLIFYRIYQDTGYAALTEREEVLLSARAAAVHARRVAEATKASAIRKKQLQEERERREYESKEKELREKQKGIVKIKEQSEINEIKKAILEARELEEGVLKEGVLRAGMLKDGVLREGVGKKGVSPAATTAEEKIRIGSLPEIPLESEKKGFLNSVKNALKKMWRAEKEGEEKKKKPLYELKFKRAGESGEAEVSSTLLTLTKAEEGVTEEEKTRINPYLLAQEAKRIKSILSKEKEVKIYKPSTLGALANHLTRRISIYLLDNFPDFFRYLYNSIRAANMQILSNTYLNIMVLLTILSFATSIAFSSYLFYKNGFAPLLIIFNTLFVSILFSIGIFTLLYYYPFMLVKNRRRNINTNLPFAINHMSAVSGAGVPPSAMFRLIAETEEYEDVSKEIGKIVELIEVFGYDLTTAIKAVSATTPSPQLKEFFDGMVSAIESGSDLKQYLRQKADEAMLSYSLEREKYLETISTYSDIYTGILIAAPLFFVVALSLVSILGGSVAGIDVNTLVVLGTYVIIPLINILFILFLEGTQPEA